MSNTVAPMFLFRSDRQDCGCCISAFYMMTVFPKNNIRNRTTIFSYYIYILCNDICRNFYLNVQNLNFVQAATANAMTPKNRSGFDFCLSANRTGTAEFINVNHFFFSFIG